MRRKLAATQQRFASNSTVLNDVSISTPAQSQSTGCVNPTFYPNYVVSSLSGITANSYQDFLCPDGSAHYRIYNPFSTTVAYGAVISIKPATDICPTCYIMTKAWGS